MWHSTKAAWNTKTFMKFKLFGYYECFWVLSPFKSFSLFWCVSESWALKCAAVTPGRAASAREVKFWCVGLRNRESTIRSSTSLSAMCGMYLKTQHNGLLIYFLDILIMLPRRNQHLWKWVKTGWGHFLESGTTNHSVVYLSVYEWVKESTACYKSFNIILSNHWRAHKRVIQLQKSNKPFIRASYLLRIPSKSFFSSLLSFHRSC